MDQLLEIAQIADKYSDRKVMFDTPLVVKGSPHQHIFTAFGIWSGIDGIYVLDGTGDWHGPLQEKQANAGFMISSIYQRLKGMQVIIASHDHDVNATIIQ